MIKNKVNIFGFTWTIKEQTSTENRLLTDYDGYCDWTSRTIALRSDLNSNFDNIEAYKRKVCRHEIVHAFLCEAGLNECSHGNECWARDEEMVDWFANTGPTIYKAWKDAGAVEEE